MSDRDRDREKRRRPRSRSRSRSPRSRSKKHHKKDKYYDEDVKVKLEEVKEVITMHPVIKLFLSNPVFQEEDSKSKKDPLSLEELLEKKKAEEAEKAKPKFLTKEERVKEALRKRQEQVEQLKKVTTF